MGTSNDSVADKLRSIKMKKVPNVKDTAIQPMGLPEKHPLKRSWTLWCYKNTGKVWIEDQREIASFQTLEEFLAVINRIEEPSKLGHGCDYSLFRTGILPMWEGPENRKGGKWSFALDMKECNLNPGILDHAWRDVLMCLVREAFGSNSRYVNGAVVKRRIKKKKPSKIEVWISIVDKEQIVDSIGETILRRCVPDERGIGFEKHEFPQKRFQSQFRFLYEKSKSLI